MKIYDLELLMSQYGDLSLTKIIGKIKGQRDFKCPKCNGMGTVQVQTRAESWGYWDAEYATRNCDLCKGIGYTYTEHKPKMIQDGWT